MNDHDASPVSIASADMRGWWIEMRSTSFLLCGPGRDYLGRFGYFERCPLGYRFPAADVCAAAEAAAEASRWFRREWRPDFSQRYPYGLGRLIEARRVEEWIELRCTGFVEEGELEPTLEFSYVELPALRAALARRARPRRRRNAKEHHDSPIP